MPMLRWTVRWGEVVLATGTGPIPPEYGLPAPRVTNGDRAVVRNGPLSAEAVMVRRPMRASRWGTPDLHFVKVLVMCLMAFAAMMVLVRERIAELRLEKVSATDEHDDIFKPLPARWVGHTGFTKSVEKHGSPLAAADLARIKRFGSKVKELKQREERLNSLIAPSAVGVLGLLRSSALEPSSNVLTAALEGSSSSGVVGGIAGGELYGAGGLGLRGSGEGIGLGSGTLGTFRVSSRDAATRRVFASARTRVLSCLDGYEGAMTTDVELFGDGRVKSVSVTGPDESVRRCVARTLEALQFPSGPESVSARWTTG
jgi:hypothetical protein